MMTATNLLIAAVAVGLLIGPWAGLLLALSAASYVMITDDEE